MRTTMAETRQGPPHSFYLPRESTTVKRSPFGWVQARKTCPPPMAMFGCEIDLLLPGSSFSGTHFISPRTVQGTISFHF